MFRSNENPDGGRRGTNSIPLALLLHPPTVSLCPAQPHFPCQLAFLILASVSTWDYDCSRIHTAGPHECSYLFSDGAHIPYRYKPTATLSRCVQRGLGIRDLTFVLNVFQPFSVLFYCYHSSTRPMKDCHLEREMCCEENIKTVPRTISASVTSGFSLA